MGMFSRVGGWTIVCALVGVSLPAQADFSRDILRERLRITERRLEAKQAQLLEQDSLLYSWNGARTQALAATLLAAADVALVAVHGGAYGALALGKGLLGPSPAGASLTYLAVIGAMGAGGVGGLSGTIAIAYLPQRGSWEFSSELNGVAHTTELSAAQVAEALDATELALADQIQTQLNAIPISGFKGNGFSLGWRTVKWLKLQRAGFEAQAALYTRELQLLHQILNTQTDSTGETR